MKIGRRLHSGFAIAAPGANTNAIAGVTWPDTQPQACRVTIQAATATIANLMVTRSGTTKALGLNGNLALAAGSVHVFDVPGLVAGDTLNVQVETDSALDILALDEVYA